MAKPCVSQTMKCLVSQEPCYMTLTQNFSQAMKACSSLGSIVTARKLHAQLISIGLDASVFIQNHLLHMYSNCGLIDDAHRVFYAIESRNIFSWNAMICGLFGTGRISEGEKLFDEMPHRDPVSWTTVMSGYFHNGRPDDAIRVFASMVRCCGYASDPFALSCAMKACGSLGMIKLAHQLHSLVEKLDFRNNMPVQSSVIDMYIKCDTVISAEKVFLRITKPSLFCWNSMIYGYSKHYGAEKSLITFNQMPERDFVTWNTMISIFSQHGFGVQGLSMFVEMWENGFRPNSMTYASVLSACASVYDLRWGSHLHARIVRLEPNLESYVGNGLIDMYAKCGHLRFAREVFNILEEKSAVSWTSLISGVARFGLEEEALVLVKQMQQAFVTLDEYTLATVLGVCSNKNFVLVGEQLHGYTIKAGMTSSIPVGNALITMYSKCEYADKASCVFELMPVRDIISWTTMLTTYSQIGKVEKAMECFSKMPERNVVTWNSMFATYVQNGFWEEALKLYKLMRSKGVSPDCITYVTAISACADLAVLKLGIQIVSHVEKLGFSSNVSVANSVVTLYSKCGRIEEARKAFDSICEKNLISWNAIMAGYAQNGHGRRVIETFGDMLSMGCKPDHVSYVSILSACSHSGLIDEGKYFFSSMIEDYGISPTSEHFACMVDMLGRAGLLEEAKRLIETSSFKPSPAVWGALLSASRTNHNSNLAELAARHLVELGAEDSGCYVLLANLYSDTGHLEAFAGVRKLMREKGIQKNPGCSWIEVDNRVHVFTVDDSNHPRIGDVYITLDNIIKKIESTGQYHCPTNALRSQRYHSEKLAVAFGLMTLPAWMPIHVMKNLRVCQDCHLVLKLISRVASRELIVRDGYRFHHFKDGICSCGDFW